MKTILIILSSLFCSVIICQSIDIKVQDISNASFSIPLNNLIQYQIINNSERTPVYVQLILHEVNDGLVGKFSTDLILLPKGYHSAQGISNFNGERFHLLHSNPKYPNLNQISTVLPSGKYGLCIEVLDAEKVLVNKQCINVELVLADRLNLIYPFDKQILEERFPVFSWTSLLNHSGGVNYHIKWVESKENSKDIANNFEAEPAFFRTIAKEENHLSYNLSYPKFNQDYGYYWQVEAIKENKIIAKSQIWNFEFKNAIANQQEHTFVKIDLESSKAIHAFSGESLDFEWHNNYNFDDPKVKIFSENNILVFDETQMETLIKRTKGNCYFHLNVKDIVLDEKVYTLVISDENRSYKIRFKKI